MTTGRLSVTVSVDLDALTVTIRPAGTLTEHNLEGLVALWHRAERTLPHCTVHLDTAFLRYGSDDAHAALSRTGFPNVSSATVSGLKRAA